MSGPRGRPPSGGLTLARRAVVAGASAFAVFTIALVLAVLWALYVYNSPGPQARAGNTTTVILRQGAGLSEITGSLERAGVIESGPLFSAMTQLLGAARELKAGEYEIKSGASMASVLDQVRNGRVVRHFVTVPEGVTAEMVIDILNREEALSGDAPVPPEGTVLPETYEFQRGEERSAVLQRMMDARDRLLASLWEHRREGLPITTPEEAVILASIVEKETGVADERPRIAAVFVNRLRSHMRLESDPTIIYGLTRGRPLGRGIRASELAAPNPYNTYQIDGLPPTPIANPGRAALAAVLDPPETDELFFVADGTGGHVFASTYQEHLQNVARWREIEREAGERAGSAQSPPAKGGAARP